MNDRLKTVMKFKGYGNPEGGYWFIGIEERLPIDNDDKLSPYKKGIMFNEKGDYSKYKAEFYQQKRKEGKRGTYTAVYDIMGKILMDIQGLNGDPTNFLDEHLFEENGSNFYTFLYPLGKRLATATLSKATKDFMGLNNMDEYYEIVEENRFKFLYKLWDDSKPKCTICFGKGNWNNFDKLLKQDKSNRLEVVENRIYFYPESNVYLVPFFGNRRGSIRDLINLLSNDIKKRIK